MKMLSPRLQMVLEEVRDHVFDCPTVPDVSALAEKYLRSMPSGRELSEREIDAVMIRFNTSVFKSRGII